eukprot:TRINITY_DN1986_c0_g1_i11.p1 TRINITY_DN1986_c0_g1~~TRINITY_DN1986_c0_g1_i11.p1  ORF type:complete len:318 (-),score=51.37 TRINITY_DN1986_c0_g1_i11:244-1197(-)
MSILTVQTQDQKAFASCGQVLLSLQHTGGWGLKEGGLSGKKLARERRRASVNTALGKDPWTEREEYDMLIAHREHKNRWSEITHHLKGKSNNTVKNRFYSIFRRIKGKVQRADFSFDSKLELLKICYMTSLMQYHLNNPMLSPKSKGRRGKDFIYSLIHNLPREKVQKYEDRLKQLINHQGSMHDLIDELILAHKTSSDAQTIQYTPTKYSPSLESVKDVPKDNLSFPEDPDILEQVQLYESFDESFRLPSLENSLMSEPESASPAAGLSPSALSEGPAAAAAGASRAACFTDTVDEWNEFILQGGNNEERESPSNL